MDPQERNNDNLGTQWQHSRVPVSTIATKLNEYGNRPEMRKYHQELVELFSRSLETIIPQFNRREFQELCGVNEASRKIA